MELYKEYQGIIKDHQQLINKIKSSNSSLVLILGDCIKVMDYLSAKQEDGVKLIDEENELFQIGFDYLSEFLEDFEIYYKDYFKRDVILFNRYAKLMSYQILLTDLLYYWKSKQKQNKSAIDLINKYLLEIDQIMVNKREISPELIEKLDNALTACDPHKDEEFLSTYLLFQIACEDYDL